MKQTKNVDVVILVSLAYKTNPHRDDMLLNQALSNYQLIVNIVAWDDDSYDFKQAKLVIIRACWDYDKRADDFFLKLEEIAKSCLLINDLKTISAYKNKYYLQSLKAKGVPIVPTEYATNFDEVFTAIKNLSSKKIVIKPAMSASGRDTYLLSSSDRKSIIKVSGVILRSNKDLVLQSYISSIETEGEKSTVVIDGAIVYSIQKTPAAGNFLVHEHHGGVYKEAQVTTKEQGFIHKLINTFEVPPVYMRVDYLRDKSGKSILLEVELIEPNLYLSRSEQVLQALTTKIMDVLGMRK